MRRLRFLSLLVVSLFLVACQSGTDTGALKIDFEKYTLDNGLQVVLHQDKSDPIASVAILYHVGSAREVTGRTGFAHLFEHLLFKRSENVGEGEFFQTIQNNGGTLNGGTANDMTIYFEVVPKDVLERVLYMESDRMGFFINTVSGKALSSEKQIVKNEKRQRVDNQPYGHTSYVIDSNLYPTDHPYNWQVIGSLEDLQNATLEDVKNFYDKWYGPNNATIVVAGDFETAEVKALIEKYFGEIKSHGISTPANIPAITLSETKKLYHEDNFARLPELRLTWPTVKQYHPDYWALNVLGQLLSQGKTTPFYKTIVEEKKLAPNASVFNNSQELAGKFTVRVRSFAGKDLDEINDGINEAFAVFERDGVNEYDLERIKAGQETSFYNGISSVLNKSFILAQYNVFAGAPDFVTKDIENIMNVTKEDVTRVYNTYIKDKHYIATSFVPKGQLDLILEGSEKADVVEEEIVVGQEGEEIVDAGEVEFEKTPSKIDRSTPPPLGSEPAVNVPPVWTGQLSNGMNVVGIEHTELPLVQFSIRLTGGMLLDNPNLIGVANMITDIMMEGTKNKTPVELEQAIEDLGSSINMFTSKQAITISGNTLVKNYDKTMALVEEILLEPRWDEEQFKLIKDRTQNSIRQRAANPNAIASDVFSKLVYGKDHILSNTTVGTAKSVNEITMDNLKEYYENYFSPSVANMHIVGNIKKDMVLRSLSGLDQKWERKNVTIPGYQLPKPVEKSTIYFVDVPNAKQSVIQTGYLALSQKDEDYYPATIMNMRLGGNFNGIVNQTLRVEKGYTYGARSGFSGSNYPGPFSVSSGVRSNVTYESVAIVKDILETYKDKYTEKDLEETKSTLIKSNARRFETLGSLLGMLQSITLYDFDHDYIKQRETVVKNMTVEKIKELADKYIKADKMNYLVVGDAKTQINRLSKIGFGAPVLLDRNAEVVTSDMVRK